MFVNVIDRNCQKGRRTFSPAVWDDWCVTEWKGVTGLEDLKSSCKYGNRPKGVSRGYWRDKSWLAGMIRVEKSRRKAASGEDRTVESKSPK